MNKNNWVFAFDLDGTLLQRNNKANEYTLDVLKKSKESGNINIVATGRGVAKTLPLLESKAIDHMDYLVCSNGTVIYDVKNKSSITLNSLDKNVFDIMKNIAQEKNLIIAIDTNSVNATSLPNNKLPEWLNDVDIMDMNILNLMSLDELSTLVHHPDTQLTQIAFRNPLKDAINNTELVRTLISNYPSEVYLTNSIYTDVNPKNTSKYNAVKYILDLLNKTNENLISFGDSGNDLELIKNSKIGIAMGNATNDAKSIAKYIISDHNSDTIGKFIQKVLDNKINLD